AIDVVTLLADACLPTILLTASLQARMRAAASAVRADTAVMAVYQRDLRAFFAPYHLPERAAAVGAASAAGTGTGRDKSKQLRQRWRRMVRDINDGVGDYAVEVMKI
ncbi:hypothetical protein HK405_004306, partial [Cladochytrium tenue]